MIVKTTHSPGKHPPDTGQPREKSTTEASTATSAQAQTPGATLKGKNNGWLQKQREQVLEGQQPSQAGHGHDFYTVWGL